MKYTTDFQAVRVGFVQYTPYIQLQAVERDSTTKESTHFCEINYIVNIVLDWYIFV